jgi:hypothetical protein
MGIDCRVGRTVAAAGSLDRVNSAQDIRSMAVQAAEGVGVNTVSAVRRLPAPVMIAADSRAGVLTGMGSGMLLVAVLLLRQRAVKREACMER